MRRGRTRGRATPCVGDSFPAGVETGPLVAPISGKRFETSTLRILFPTCFRTTGFELRLTTFVPGKLRRFPGRPIAISPIGVGDGRAEMRRRDPDRRRVRTWCRCLSAIGRWTSPHDVPYRAVADDRHSCLRFEFFLLGKGNGATPVFYRILGRPMQQCQDVSGGLPRLLQNLGARISILIRTSAPSLNSPIREFFDLLALGRRVLRERL